MLATSSLVLDISSADLAPLSIVISGVAILLTLMYQRSTTRISMLSQVFENLFSDETRKMRYIVRERREECLRIKEDRDYVLPKSTEAAGRYVASAYDRIGFFLTKNNRLTEDFLKWQGDVVLQMWDIIGVWVTERGGAEHLSAIRYRHPRATKEMVAEAYCNYFEWLAKKAMERENRLFNDKATESHKPSGHPE